VDDNFAVNKKRTMSLLHDMIDAKAQMPWFAQISPNLLEDEELIELIAESGGRWLFLGVESIEARTLTGLNKSFNKPDEYRAVLRGLARRNIYAVTSFIFGMDEDTPGVADRTLREIRRWPPGLPVFSQLTPYPGTALYKRLEISGRLARAKHWMDFSAFEMAHKPARMTMAEVKKEIHQAWSSSYSPESNATALESIPDKSPGQRAIHLIGRMVFRGLYFPQMNRRAWLRVVLENRHALFRLLGDCLGTWAASHRASRWLGFRHAEHDGSLSEPGTSGMGKEK
jgi:radical SAM superfamily enzyme YgiQ (UPF0313 family)